MCIRDRPKLNVSGSVDAYFRNNITSANDGAANTLLGTGDYSIFNNDSGFSAGLANVTLSYGDETVGFIADLGYGPRMDAWNGGDVVNEAYMYWNASDKVMLMMGRFNSWMGYERLSAANNFHYSMSHMFSYSARNFNGIVAQFDIGTNLRGGIGVMNPVNQVYGNNGDYSKALEYYHQALELNSRLPQALNNIAVIYHYQGTKASEKKEFELAQNSFEKASNYWKKAIRLAPNNYIEAQNWLKITGKLNDNENF